jgi:transcriptional regulator with XRE-family HTH domain
MQPPPEQPQGAKLVGPRLAEARQAAGLSLHDVERQTRIPRRYLQALEADQFNVLPAPVYARGYLRNYARFLGLDENELLMGLQFGEQPQSVLPAVRPRRSGTVLWMVAGLAFGAGILLWAVLGLHAFDAIEGVIDDIDLGGGGAPAATPIITTPTPGPTCDDLLGRDDLSPEEQQFVANNCVTPTPEPPTEVPFRTDCDEIRGTDYESADERDYFLDNCLTPPAG